MTLFIENEAGASFDFHVDELVSSLLEAGLACLECPYEVECSLLITGNEEIQALNHRFRHIDKPTDVLSFPMVSFQKPCDYDMLEDGGAYFSPETGELLLGDIVISYEKALEQSLQYGHALKREFSFLIVHSLLHLFGYDHMEKEESDKMETIQESILNGLGIGRALNKIQK